MLIQCSFSEHVAAHFSLEPGVGWLLCLSVDILDHFRPLVAVCGPLLLHSSSGQPALVFVCPQQLFCLSAMQNLAGIASDRSGGWGAASKLSSAAPAMSRVRFHTFERVTWVLIITNRALFVLFSSQNRTFGPSFAAIHKIPISRITVFLFFEAFSHGTEEGALVELKPIGHTLSY
jgi:hypothetical protein